MINLSTEPQTIQHGDRIAQMVIAPFVQATLAEVGELNETVRGAGDSVIPANPEHARYRHIVSGIMGLLAVSCGSQRKSAALIPAPLQQEILAQRADSLFLPHSALKCSAIIKPPSPNIPIIYA